MSGAMDEDVRRSVARGRETLGAMLSAAQTHLQKVAIVFLVGFLGMFYALPPIFDRLKADLFAKLPPAVAKETSVNAITPFDVVLLQVKIALVVGALISVPVLLYYSRSALKERGYWPSGNYGRIPLTVVGLLGVLLFAGGVAYAYNYLFPLLFKFLASNALSAGFQPTYSIVKWAQFVLILSVAMGLAAELPLIMVATVYAGVVPPRTYREYWRHAIVVIAIIASVINGSPDPFSMSLVAAPMIVLYGVGLVCTTITASVKTGRSPKKTLRERWRRVVGFPVGIAIIVGGAIAAGIGGYLNTLIRKFPYYTPSEPVFKYIGPMLGLPRPAAIAVVAVAVFFALVVLTAAYYIVRDSGASSANSAETGNPSALDVEALDEEGVRAAPIEAFAAMSEQEATAQASMAVSDGDPDKARAILDRFDAADEAATEANGDEPAIESREGAAESDGTDADTADGNEINANLKRTTANVVDALTTEETTEEDIGGYYYDLAFIGNTLKSRSFRLIGLFVIVLAGSFSLLSRGGIGYLKRDFLARLPATVRPEQVGIVTLHPVEALVFEIKLSTLFAALVVLPFVLYYAWPAFRDRGLIRGGDRRALIVWAGALFVSLIGGIALGYAIVAPTIISWLAADIIGANMVVAFRISAAGWLVFFTTAGIGLLAMIPVTMVLFQRAGLVPYRAMRGRWREVTVAVFGFTAYASPRGVFMMFILGIPIMAFYGLGLGLLWIYTLGGRRATQEQDRRESAD